MTNEIRRNRFNGESVELTAAEAEKHDKIFYHEAMATLEDQKLTWYYLIKSQAWGGPARVGPSSRARAHKLDR
jgi:hypothetical protein